MEGTTLELKYCERCGALGLRRPQSTENYCESCARLLTKHAISLHRGRRLPHRRPDREMRPTVTLVKQALPSLGTGVLP